MKEIPVWWVEIYGISMKPKSLIYGYSRGKSGENSEKSINVGFTGLYLPVN